MSIEGKEVGVQLGTPTIAIQNNTPSPVESPPSKDPE